MRSSTLSLLPLLAALGLMACAAAPALSRDSPRVNFDKVRRIVTLGDSITQGGGQPGGYVWQIDQALRTLYPDRKIEVVNAGIGGHKSNDMLARFQRDVLDKQPDLVTISVGINDVWHGFSPEHPAGYGPNRVPLLEYRANVASMLTAARQAKVQVVLFTTTIFEDEPESIRNLKVSAYNRTLRELAKLYGVPLADQNQAFMQAWARNRGTGIRLTNDQVHMARPGDTLMARTALLSFGIPEERVDEAQAEALKRLTATP